MIGWAVALTSSLGMLSLSVSRSECTARARRDPAVPVGDGLSEERPRRGPRDLVSQTILDRTESAGVR